VTGPTLCRPNLRGGGDDGRLMPSSCELGQLGIRNVVKVQFQACGLRMGHLKSAMHKVRSIKARPWPLFVCSPARLMSLWR